MECADVPNPRIDEDSISPIQEGYDQIKDKPETYYTRETGREGNRIYEYAYWRLRSLQDGKAFKCLYRNFAPFGTLLETDIPKQSIQDKGITSVTEYPFKLEYYINHREEIKKFLKYKDVPLKRDCVIHLRLDDVLNDCLAYTLIPFTRYIELFNSIPVPENITIIGKPIDNVQKEYIKILKRSLKELYRRRRIQMEITINTNNTIQEDFDIISGCKTLVASTSVFWFWSSFLSNNVEKVYYPCWGVCKQMRLHIYPEKYIPFAQDLHPIKIKKDDLHRILL